MTPSKAFVVEQEHAGYIVNVFRFWIALVEALERYRTAHIRHHCRKTTFLGCHRCPINTGVERMNYI